MATAMVIGAQWGDEGKGKIVDYLAAKADVVVRSQGGNNAGHTVVTGGKAYPLRLMPSGIMYPGTICIVGTGVVVDPKSLLEEMENLEKQGIDANTCRSPREHRSYSHTTSVSMKPKNPARAAARSAQQRTASDRATQTRSTVSASASATSWTRKLLLKN